MIVIVDVDLLGKNSVWTRRQVTTFLRDVLPLSSGLTTFALETEAVFNIESLYLRSFLHGLTTQKTAVSIFTAARTSDVMTV
jgi:hypothetical protein